MRYISTIMFYVFLLLNFVKMQLYEIGLSLCTELMICYMQYRLFVSVINLPQYTVKIFYKKCDITFAYKLYSMAKDPSGDAGVDVDVRSLIRLCEYIDFPAKSDPYTHITLLLSGDEKLGTKHIRLTKNEKVVFHVYDSGAAYQGYDSGSACKYTHNLKTEYSGNTSIFPCNELYDYMQ